MTVPAPGTKVPARVQFPPDRKSTRLNSSHSQISYAVFCLKKKKKPQSPRAIQPANVALAAPKKTAGGDALDHAVAQPGDSGSITRGAATHNSRHVAQLCAP